MHNFINITGEIFIQKCTAACSHHLHNTLTWEIKFQERDTKIPTLLLCCYSQTKERSPMPLASPHGLLAARKNIEKGWVSNKENCRAGGAGAGTGWHCGPCVSCAVPTRVLHTGVGKVGEVGTGASPRWELGAQRHFQPYTDLLPLEELGGLQGSWSLGMDLGSL